MCFSSFLIPLILLINSVKHVRFLINLKKGLLNLVARLALSLMKFGQALNRKVFFPSLSYFFFFFFFFPSSPFLEAEKVLSFSEETEEF